MIASTPLIDQAIAEGAQVALNLSGGKDCGAVSALTMRRLDELGHPRERRFAIHAYLGRAEWKSSPAQVEAQAAALGLKLVVVSNRSGDLVSRFEGRWELGLADYVDLRLYNLRGPWASPSLKFCQSEQKIQVMGPHLARAFRGQTIINVVGIRREESNARRSAEVEKIQTRYAAIGNKFGTRMITWQPGVDLLEAEVYEINRRYGIPLAESYGLGGSRHSCAFCIMASLNDLVVGASAEGNHWLYRHYVSMEAASTFSFQPNRWLGDVAPHLLDTSLRARLDRAKALAAERRAIESAMPARHRYVKGWPLYLPTIDEAETVARTRRQILAHHNAASPYVTASAVRDRFAELLAMKRDRDLAEAA